jgi:tRNA(Arg) A34 adenosine deaminase TadA
MSGLQAMREWRQAHESVRRSLELAHEALRAGGLPVGAVILDASGKIIAHGRNHAYDPPAGDDPLQDTPIAHAEMNALARIPTKTDLSVCTLWSTQRPCGMCAAAAAFTGVGDVRFLAPDPSDEDSSDPVGIDSRWMVLANVMFLEGVSRYSGASAPMICRARVREPETAALLSDVGPILFASPGLEFGLEQVWPMIEAAARARADRRLG